MMYVFVVIEHGTRRLAHAVWDTGQELLSGPEAAARERLLLAVEQISAGS